MTANFPPPQGEPQQAASGTSYSISTPRLLRLLRLAIVLTSLAAGVVSVLVLMSAASGLGGISTGTQQLERLQLIKGDILRADGLATNGLVQGTSEPASQREQYKNHLTEAAKLTVDASNAQSLDRGDLAEVNAALVQYAASMELGRTTTKTDAKAGMTYVAEAATALRERAVPALDRLIAANQGRVDAARAVDRAWAILIAAVPALVLLAAAIVAARRTRRLLNLGLVVALVASVALWRIVDTTLGNATAAVDSARSGNLRTALSASYAYADVADARSWEGRAALQPASAADEETQWKASVAKATQQVGQVTTSKDALTKQLEAYTAAHGKLATAVASKKSADIAKLAGDTSASGVNTTFTAFADSARTVATDAGQATSRDMATRTDELNSGAILAGLLGLIAAVAGALGLGARLREYR